MTSEMKLADLRHRAGLSQPQLAKRMGVSRVQVSRIEASYPDVMFTTLRRYLDALGLEIRYTGELVAGELAVDVSSSEVVRDASRIFGETRKLDPTRGAGRQVA